MYQYKIKEGAGVDELLIPGVGKTVDGKISSPVAIENPLLVLVTDTPASQPAPAAPAPAPAAAPLPATPAVTSPDNGEK